MQFSIRGFSAAWCLFLTCLAVASDERAAIREFAPEVTSRLGRDLFEHDRLAWVATDVLFAHVTREQLEAEGLRGWIVDESGEVPLVRFLRAKGDEVEAAYDLIFTRREKPDLVVPVNRVLSVEQRMQNLALSAARESVFDGRRPWCGGSPNHVVLRDPAGDGWLVYLLRPKPAGSAVPVGGHYRVSVTADGSRVVQVDQLFASCVTLDREAVAEGKELVSLGMTHIVSSQPLETHVFLSLQERLPFTIVTRDGFFWSIEEGILRKTDQRMPANAR